MSWPREVETGVERFNRGEYFEAHEALEDAWRAEGDPERRRLWHGLTQLAVGFTHLKRGNPAGARSLLESGLAKLQPLRPAKDGIELEELLGRLDRCLDAIARSSRDHSPFDWSLAPRIERAEVA